MKDEDKTKAELIKQLKTLRKERERSALIDITKCKQAESELQIERDKLTAIFESMADGVYIVNKDHDIQYANPVLKKTFGSPEGKKCHKYFNDSDEPCNFCKNEEVFAGKTVRWEWTSPKYGKTYDLIDTPMKNEDGSISKLEIFRDITEHKQAEESLKESEAKYRAVLEQSADNIFLADLETKKILESNVSLRNLLGYSADEMKKLTIYDFVARPKDEIKKKLEQLQKEDKTVIRERKYLRKDGSLVDVEMVRNLITFGNKKVLCVVSRDISERKKAEETLKQSEKNYRDLFNNATDAIYIQDRECRFLDVNQGAVEMYGYPKEFFIGKTPEFLSAPGKNDLKKITGFVEDAFNGKPRQYDFWGIRKNGEIFPKIVRSQKGIYMGKEVVVTFATDITERMKLEEELLVKNEVFEASITANSTSDNEGILTYVNNTFIKIFGYKNKEEAVGKPISDFLKFEDEAINIITALNKTGVWEGEYTGLKKDGTTFTAYGLATTIKDRSGDSVGCQSAVLDISDRKRTEESLKESEEKYSSVVENSKDGIIVVQKGIIKFFNQAILNLSGYNLEELIDKEFEPLLLSPEYRKLIMDRYQARLAGKETPSIYEMEIIRKDGISVPIEVSNTTITYEGEKATLSFIRNITERKQAEEALRASRDYLEKLTNSMWDAVFSVKMPERVIEWANDSFRLTGYEPSECIGKSPAFLYLNKDNFLDFGNKLKDAIAAGKDVLHDDQLMKRKNGETFPVEITVTFHRENDEIISLTTIVRDITDKKQAEDALRNSQKAWKTTFDAMSDWVTLIDHNTRTIINSNRAGEEITGHSLKEIIGKKCCELVHNSSNPIPDCPMQRLLKSKKREETELKLGEDGPWLLVSVDPVFDENKEMVNVVHIVKDITKRKQAEERLKKTMNATIETVSRMIEAKDPYTAGHQQRVSQLAVAIAKELNIPQDKIEGIRIASLIHDIGKMGIPTEILSKPIVLTDVEFNLIKGHSQIGYNVLKSIEFPWPVEEIVLQHHEKMNGSGYPRGLKGDEILSEAKIIGVADVVEAMSSHRPYRPALGIDAALEEISKNRGIFYDPEIVVICLRLFKEKGFKFE